MEHIVRTSVTTDIDEGEAVGSFSAREPRACGAFDVGNTWTLKWYEMSAGPNPIPGGVRAAAQEQVRDALHGQQGGQAGFVVLHVGEEAVWLLCDTWHADILHHLLWRAELSRPEVFASVRPGGPTACVHELAVVAHERNAYVAHVLDADPPDWAGYVSDQYGALDRQRRRVLLTFDQAWRAGDVDLLMTLMADEPRYAASTGPGPGQVHEGRAAVRRAFTTVIRAESAAAPTNSTAPPLDDDGIWLHGDRAVTRWQYVAEDPAGRPSVVHGVDLWEFDGFQLKSKDAFRKAWPTLGSTSELVHPANLAAVDEESER
jgi:hypothetical protein